MSTSRFSLELDHCEYRRLWSPYRGLPTPPVITLAARLLMSNAISFARNVGSFHSIPYERALLRYFERLSLPLSTSPSHHLHATWPFERWRSTMSNDRKREFLLDSALRSESLRSLRAASNSLSYSAVGRGSWGDRWTYKCTHGFRT